MILRQNKEYFLSTSDNYFGDDIVKKSTGEKYIERYFSSRGEPNLKTIFNVSKELNGSEFKILKDDEYYEIRNGTYKIITSINGKQEVPIFTSTKASINFIRKLESGKIKYKLK